MAFRNPFYSQILELVDQEVSSQLLVLHHACLLARWHADMVVTACLPPDMLPDMVVTDTNFSEE